MLSALERGFEKFGIDFYLVGDIDFAVLINDKGTYEALKTYLVETEGFHPFKGNAFVLIWKDKTEVDLLPFGAIEDEEGKVTVEGTGYTTVHVPGFTEVYEQGLPEMELEGEHQFKFCTLPGIVVLKLIAWDDRPETRRDDIKDISDILNHFFNMYDNEIWDNHNDLFADENSNLEHIAARVMGREMRKISTRNEKLFSRIEGILNANTDDMPNSKMAAIMIEYFGNTIEDNVLLLQQLKQGFTENNQA